MGQGGWDHETSMLGKMVKGVSPSGVALLKAPFTDLCVNQENSCENTRQMYIRDFCHFVYS